mgnify:CR=1 FL=1
MTKQIEFTRFTSISNRFIGFDLIDFTAFRANNDLIFMNIKRLNLPADRIYEDRLAINSS